MYRVASVPVLLIAAMLAGAAQTLQAQPARPREAVAQAMPASRPAAVPLVEFRLAQREPAQGLVPVPLAEGPVWAAPQAVLTRGDVQSVVAVRSKEGRHYVRFAFNPAGAQKLAALAQRYAGKILMLNVNGYLIAAPTLTGPMNDGALFVPFASEQHAAAAIAAIVGSGANAAR